MRIKVTSVYVDDQEKALRFYSDVLGFVPVTTGRSRSLMRGLRLLVRLAVIGAHERWHSPI